MGTKRHQSRCKECGYIWYPREKKDDCPKCKSSEVAYTGGLGRWFLIFFILGGVIAAGVAGRFLRGKGTDPPPSNIERSEKLPRKVPEGIAETSKTENSPEPSGHLTEQRTWTSKNGRTLKATLLRLELVEGRYVGIFEKPGGETFEYKIGNLSEADVEFVKGLVGKQ